MSALSIETWATLAAAIISLAALTLDHLKTRSPSKAVSDCLNNHEERIAALEGWKNS